VNAIGKIELLATPNHDRLDEMNFTIPQVTDYVPKVIAGGFNGLWINITNPCDVVTGQIARLSGLPRGHVFGTGTGLDTARLKNILFQQTGVAHNSISGCMMGEHGNSIMIPWSQISFGGQPLADLAKKDSRFVFDNEEVKKQAVANAWVTVDGKGCTEYGICTALCRLVAAILHDEKAIIPVSTLLDGEYGEHGVYVGVPAVIGADGVEHIVEYDLPADEMAAFHTCCEDVRANMKLHPQILQ
jgi:L-lactate dehydrogenase